MNRIAISAICALVCSTAIVELPACSGAQTQAVIQDITPAGACIATQLLEGGATDPIQIVAACVGVTIADVIQVVETLTAAQPDSGTSPTTLQLRLAAVHTRALGLRTPR